MTVINIGGLYYVFMIMLAIFCTNAINIFSGVNGLESGQSAMIALSLMCFNILQIMRWTSPDADSSMSAQEQERLLENNIFSLNLISPFAGVAIALTWHNWWPSAVFVGDTWCYFAGMTFAVAAILGHSSKTLLLFFIPQVSSSTTESITWLS